MDDKRRDEIAKKLLRQRTKEDQIASIAGSLDVLRKWPIFRVELKKDKKVHTAYALFPVGAEADAGRCCGELMPRYQIVPHHQPWQCWEST